MPNESIRTIDTEENICPADRLWEKVVSSDIGLIDNYLKSHEKLKRVPLDILQPLHYGNQPTDYYLYPYQHDYNLTNYIRGVVNKTIRLIEQRHPLRLPD